MPQLLSRREKEVKVRRVRAFRKEVRGRETVNRGLRYRWGLAMGKCDLLIVISTSSF
jgi:hypothetical protein